MKAHYFLPILALLTDAVAATPDVTVFPDAETAAINQLAPFTRVDPVTGKEVFVSPNKDISDDPAIWIHPKSPAESKIFGVSKSNFVTDGYKVGGIYIHDLNGSKALSSQWEEGVNWYQNNQQYNNCDTTYRFKAGTEEWDLLGASNFTDYTGKPKGNIDAKAKKIDIFRVVRKQSSNLDLDGDFEGLVLVGRILLDDQNNDGVDDRSNAFTQAPGKAPYGFCFYRMRGDRPSDPSRHFAIVTDFTGQVAQYELLYNSNATQTNQQIRGVRKVVFDATPGADANVEGVCVDEFKKVLYASGEVKGTDANPIGLFRYQIKADGVIDPTNRVLVMRPDKTKPLVGDIEGSTLYYLDMDNNGLSANGYLIVSSQGDSKYAVFDRNFEPGKPNAVIKTFSIANNPNNNVDGSVQTDGVCVTNVNLGGAFSSGMFIAHDSENTPPPNSIPNFPSNYKLVPWARIANATNGDPAFQLKISTNFNPRD
jgi:3-phytase